MTPTNLKLTPPHPTLLSRIDSPADLKRLNEDQLAELAQEIRDQIVWTVSRTGGHLAPGLGVVELTIALHYVFNAPADKIIFDVGHQAYTHKLLTGRRDRFSTLRQYGGVSGFPKRDESPYDALDTGHASTSISAGLGMAAAKELKHDQSKVICVIGDGSMTGGMAFEGLNQAGDLEKDLIVILNDNEMSISPNVGALSSFLSRQLTGRPYTNLKKRFQEAVNKLPQGENVIHWARRTEEAVKSFFTPGMLFEAFKFSYVGPIDGHNLPKMIEALKRIQPLSGPLLVHVLTTKGKGFQPAEDNPAYFHGVGSFAPKDKSAKGKGKDKPQDAPEIMPQDEVEAPHPDLVLPIPSYTDVFGRIMCRLGRTNPNLAAITAAMPEGTGLNAFNLEFPERSWDVGIAEQHAITFAAGLALEGLTPVVAVYSTFMQRALDQIIHDVCLQNLHVVLAMDRGGLVGEDGPTHHGAFDLSFLRYVPNLTIMVPRDENQLQHMLKTAVEMTGPVALRYPRGKGLGVDMDPEFQVIEPGTGELLREGDDVLLLGVGSMVEPARRAAELLAEQGINAAVVDARFVKPLDEKLILEQAIKCRAVITLEENAVQGGFGSAVLELLAREGLTKPVKLIGLPDRFIEHGAQKLLRAKLGLDPDGLLETIAAWMADLGLASQENQAG